MMKYHDKDKSVEEQCPDVKNASVNNTLSNEAMSGKLTIFFIQLDIFWVLKVPKLF